MKICVNLWAIFLTVFKCKDCDDNAEYFCRKYEPFEEFYLCEECLEKKEEHEDDIEVRIITNSPRMGCCGYDGELDNFNFRNIE